MKQVAQIFDYHLLLTILNHLIFQRIKVKIVTDSQKDIADLTFKYIQNFSEELVTDFFGN